MARMDRCQIQVTRTSWIQSSCTIFRTVVILSRGHCRDRQLLTAQVCAGFSLHHPPGEVGEEVIQGPFLQAKVYLYL